MLQLLRKLFGYLDRGLACSKCGLHRECAVCKMCHMCRGDGDLDYRCEDWND